MTRPPKTPRPPKSPIIRSDPHPETIDPTVSLIHEKLIGRTAIEWAKLEATMSDAIHSLLGVSLEYGRHVTSRMDATALIKMMRELGQLRLSEAEFHKLSVICDKIDIRREDRNLIIHGTWGRPFGDNMHHALSTRIKSDEPSRIVAETFPRTRMLEIISDIRSLKLALGKILLVAPPSTPGEQPPSK
jgi:hypothetical protein